MDDYELSEQACSSCDHAPTHRRECDVIGCEDGYIDEHANVGVNHATRSTWEPS